MVGVFREEGNDIKAVLAGYFFYGEETFLAYQFIDELKTVLFSDEESDPVIERFNLESHPWREIIDSARSAPLLFSSSRLIIVESPLRKRENIPSPKEDLSSQDKKLLEAYFASPVPDNVLAVIFPGKIKKTSGLIKFLSTLPSSAVAVKEAKPLKNWELVSWIERKFSASDKRADQDAVERLIELAGNNLRRIDNEIEKVVIYMGENKHVSVDDVNQVSGWVRSFVEWEVSESLETADCKKCLIVVNRLLDKEGVAPVNIMGLIAGFFRDLLLVKLRLSEGKKDRKVIFKEVKPQILEKYGRLYQDKFNQLFSMADSVSMQDLKHILSLLGEIDLKLRTTSLSFQVLIEGFLLEYCWLRKYKKMYGR